MHNGIIGSLICSLTALAGCGPALLSREGAEDLSPAYLDALEKQIAQTSMAFRASDGMEIGAYYPLVEAAVLADRDPEINLEEVQFICEQARLYPHLIYLACSIAMDQGKAEVHELLIGSFDDPAYQQVCEAGAALWH